MKVLLDAKADPNMLSGNQHWSPLSVSRAPAASSGMAAQRRPRVQGAVKTGHADRIEMLLAAGADPNLDFGDGTTLHTAVLASRVDAVEPLVDGGAEVALCRALRRRRRR